MMDKQHIIYKITNMLNDRFYIGMHTGFPNDRYFGSGKRIKAEIKKYGRENFKKEILEILPTREALKLKEAEIVNENLLTNQLCLNLMLGGEGGWEQWNENGSLQSQRAIRGNEIQKKKRIENPEWYKVKLEKQSLTQKVQYSKGERTSIFQSAEFQSKMSDRAQSDKAKEQRKVTRIERGFQQGQNNSQFGIKRIGINKNGKIKKILPHQLQEFLNDGWFKGFKNMDL